MLDFPTPTSIGQVYTGTNGVTYIWDGTLWLASGTSAGGDFMVRHSVNYGPISGTMSTVILNTVATGNSGNWYNTANGRWTPPAGRYFVSFVCSFTNNGTLSTRLAKNGIVLVDGVGSTYTNLPWANVAIDCTVDMNGTDYVEAQAGGAGLILGSPATVFAAYPISGIKGPPGDPGQLGFRLLQRTAVSSAVADVSIQGIASDINDIEFRFDLTPVTADDTLRLQFYNAAGTLITSGYVFSQGLWQHGSALGASVVQFTSVSSGITTSIVLHYASAGNGVYTGSGGGIRGDGNVYNIREATRIKSANTRSAYFNNALTQQNSCVGSGTYNVNGAISGVRLFFGSGNIASGTFSVWGSP